MKGFFRQSLPQLRPALSLVPLCGVCGLHKGCLSPKMPVTGEGNRKILIIGEAPGCISGDSLIDTAFRDKSKFPDGIPIKDLVGKKDFYVYSFDIENQKMVLGRVKRVWRTGRKRVYRVTYEWKYAEKGRVKHLRNSLTVTSNHPFLLKRGLYKDPFKGIGEKVDYLSIERGLSVGHSLQPFHRSSSRYAFVGPFAKEMVKESRFLLGFKLGRPLGRGPVRSLWEECHHVDENKLNDEWENLELRTTSSHAGEHTGKVNPMDRPGAREKHSKIMTSRKYRTNQSKRMKEILSDPVVYQARLEQLEKSAPKISATLKEKYKDPEFYFRYLLNRQKVFGYSDLQVHRKFLEKFPGHPIPKDNHKVVSIEYVGVRDVYDMEVEEYHNFAVNGIFVHNSEEDSKNRQFIGKTGRHLREELGKLGLDVDRDCWLTNAASCRPSKNALPDKAIEYCRPKVIQDIKRFNPELIILLGSEAVKSVLGWLWKGEPGGITRWAGWQIPYQKLNSWITPTFHPSHVLRSREERNTATEKYFLYHLEQALTLQGRPWKRVPDYKSKVEKIYDPQEAAQAIRGFLDSKLIAWDLECNSLKPDSQGSRIHSCSVSDGKKTIAFPWHGPVEAAMKELLRSEVGKIGWNLKYEHRWALAKLGVRVRNWKWDGMIAAHVLDNRRGVCGLKFQSFARLGQESYDDSVKSYLQAKEQGSNSLNKIEQADLGKILDYNGLDSLLEWKLARLQARDLGVEL